MEAESSLRGSSELYSNPSCKRKSQPNGGVYNAWTIGERQFLGSQHPSQENEWLVHVTQDQCCAEVPAQTVHMPLLELEAVQPHEHALAPGLITGFEHTGFQTSSQEVKGE